MDLTHRPRRLRQDRVRDLVSETSLEPADLIAPVFVDATTDERTPIESMPGHDRVPIDGIVARVEEVLETGVEAVMLFGIPESKDPEGSRAWADDGVVQEAVRRITSETDATSLQTCASVSTPITVTAARSRRSYAARAPRGRGGLRAHDDRR